MKSFILSVVAILIMISVPAQITITYDDLLDVGDSVSLAVVDSTPPSFNPGPAGANMHWDFSDLVMDTTSTLAFIDPTSTPYGASFPGSNIALEGLIAEFGVEGYGYLTKNISVLQIDGFGGSYDIFEDVVAPMEPPEVMFDFPVNYLDSSSQTSIMDIRIESPEPPADSLRLKLVTTVVTEVDAWGELTTPSWTGQVLRIKDERTIIDSVWVKLLFFWVYLESSTNVTHTYKYMANDMGYAMMQFNSDSSDTEFSGINYLVPEDVGIIDYALEELELSIFPNPATDEITIDTRNLSLNTQYSILIHDLYGRVIDEVKVTKAQARIDVSDYPAGVYHAILGNEKGILGKGKFVVR